MADFTANVAAVATVTPGYLYTVRDVASSGALGGVATADASVAVVRALAANVDAVGNATSLFSGNVYSCTATVNAAATTTLDYLYRVRDVAASGALGGVATVTVSITVNSYGATTHVCSAFVAGTSASGATLYRITPVDGGVAAGTSATSASMFRYAHRDAQVDAAASVSVAILAVLSGGTAYPLAPAVDATSAASAAVALLAHRDTQADATSSASATVSVLANRDTQADAVSTVSAAIVAVLSGSLITQADAAATVSASVNVVRALSTEAGASASIAVAVSTDPTNAHASGRYRDQHARAFALVQRMENGDFSAQHARAFARVFEKGV